MTVILPQPTRAQIGMTGTAGDEAPSVVQRFLRVSERPAETFVAGLSMGGYGAWKWALRHPDRFAAAASLSGAVDLSGIADGFDWPEDPHMFRRLFPDGAVPAADDLFALLPAADPSTVPALWLGCGSEDPVYDANRRLDEACRTAGIEVTTSWMAGAEHDWSLWDSEIQNVLDWLPIHRSAED